MADVFSLLGDPGRLRLLLALNNASELCVSDLATDVGMDESAVSHALRLLRAYEVVGVRREGRHAYYAITDDHVRLLIEATPSTSWKTTEHAAAPGRPDSREAHDHSDHHPDALGRLKRRARDLRAT